MNVPITIISNSAVSYNSMGGGDKIFIEMARVWKTQGHPLTILGCRETGRMCERSGLGNSFVKVSSFDVEKMGLFLAYSLRAIFSVFAPGLVKEGIIYSASDFWPDVLFALIQKLKNKRLKWAAGIYLIAQNPFAVKSARNFKGFLYWAAQRISICIMREFSDLAVTLCSEDREFLIKKAIPDKRVVFISGGIDTEIIDKIGQPSEKKYDGCFIGRFHSQKGLPELALTWKKLIKRMPQAKLAIIGWGSKYWVDSLNQLIEKNGLKENVSLLGFLDNEEKYKVLKASRVFMFPSSYESWGIVIAEAFGCACPVVAFEIAATKKFKKGIILIRPFDTDSFADKVFELINNSELYNRLSVDAKAASKEYSWEKSAGVITKGLGG